MNVSGRLERLRKWICGDHQNLIRVVGSRWSAFQPSSGRFFLHLPMERSSILSREEEDNNQVPVLTLSDLNWLATAEENSQPDSSIRHRCEYYGFPFSPEVPMGVDYPCPRISTPVFGALTRDVIALPSHYSTVLAGGLSLLDTTANLDQTGSERITALEAELASLKEQMAQIIMAKERKTEVRKQNIVTVPNGTDFSVQLSKRLFSMSNQ